MSKRHGYLAAVNPSSVVDVVPNNAEYQIPIHSGVASESCCLCQTSRSAEFGIDPIRYGFTLCVPDLPALECAHTLL